MQLTFTGKNVETTTALKDYTTDRFKRLEHFNIEQTRITYHLENLTHTAEAHIQSKSGALHASAESSDMYAAIDELVDKLSVQLKKQKDKITDHHR